MRQLTIRGFDEQLERTLRQLARDRRISLNRAALELMRRGAGQTDLPASVDRVGSALESFFDVWTEQDAAELERALEPLERIDPDLWS